MLIAVKGIVITVCFTVLQSSIPKIERNAMEFTLIPWPWNLCETNGHAQTLSPRHLMQFRLSLPDSSKNISTSGLQIETSETKFALARSTHWEAAIINFCFCQVKPDFCRNLQMDDALMCSPWSWRIWHCIFVQVNAWSLWNEIGDVKLYWRTQLSQWMTTDRMLLRDVASKFELASDPPHSSRINAQTSCYFRSVQTQSLLLPNN